MAATKIKASPFTAIIAAVLVAGAVFAALFVKGMEETKRAALAKARNEVRDLRTNVEKLAEFTPEALEVSRQKAAIFRATLLDEEAQKRFLVEFQTIWKVRELNQTATHEYRKIDYEFSISGARISDWPRLADSLRRIQGSRGVAVREARFTTSGDDKVRVFERVSIYLTVFVKRSPST